MMTDDRQKKIINNNEQQKTNHCEIITFNHSS